MTERCATSAALNELEDFVSFVRAYDPSHHFSTSGPAAEFDDDWHQQRRFGSARPLSSPAMSVLGRDGGVIFIPPQLAEQVVQSSELTHLGICSAINGCARASTRPVKSTLAWTSAIEEDFTGWLGENIDKLPVGRAQVQEILNRRRK
jgi:hypothetical protein